MHEHNYLILLRFWVLRMRMVKLEMEIIYLRAMIMANWTYSKGTSRKCVISHNGYLQLTVWYVYIIVTTIIVFNFVSLTPLYEVIGRVNSFLWYALNDNSQTAPRKAVDLDHSYTLQPLIWDQAYCWYLNESSLHGEFEYVIIWIQGSSHVEQGSLLGQGLE